MVADDTNPRPLKRARSSLGQDRSPLLAPPFSLAQFEHHPEFWFDDGNIILVAQNTGFRIYRGLLAAQSTIFADMFASATSTADEALEGCPVIHLTDSGDDLAHLIRILLPTSPTSCRTPDRKAVHSFDEIFALVRLAHKYDIQSVQDHEIRALQEYWLTSDFDVLSSPLKSTIRIDLVHYIGAVNLARLTDTHLMLPLALYWCCYLGSELLDGWTREDGTVEYLSTEDVKRCFDARIALSRREFFLVSRIFSPVPSQRCKNRGRCAPIIAKMARSATREDRRVVIHALWEWSRVVEKVDGMCEGCEQVLYERDKAERRRIWNALPQIFGITVDGWGEPGGGGEVAGDAA